jgi:hypothetical protein
LEEAGMTESPENALRLPFRPVGGLLEGDHADIDDGLRRFHRMIEASQELPPDVNALKRFLRARKAFWALCQKLASRHSPNEAYDPMVWQINLIGLWLRQYRITVEDLHDISDELRRVDLMPPAYELAQPFDAALVRRSAARLVEAFIWCVVEDGYDHLPLMTDEVRTLMFRNRFDFAMAPVGPLANLELRCGWELCLFRPIFAGDIPVLDSGRD